MTDHELDADAQERPLSGTAVASLVFGLLLCIPGAGIPGAALGAIGFATTGADGSRRGRGLAVAGLVLSVVGIAGWAIAAVSAKQLWDTAVAPTMAVIFKGPEQTLTAAFADDQTAFEADWMPGQAPTEVQRKAFAEGVTLVLGKFQSASVDETGGPPPTDAMGPGGDAFELPFVFRFENGSVTTLVRFQPSIRGEVTPSGSYVGIDRIEVKGPDGAEFVLGGDDVPTTAPVGGAATAPETAGEDEAGEP